MRRVRYQVACSLDGFIAGPNDDFDWIPPEPTFDFDALYEQFDILLMGRRTYEIVSSMGETFRGKHIIVASRTLRQEECPDVEVVNANLKERIVELRNQSGKDIWLYGGGQLFAQLLAWDLVDTVEPAILPIILGRGIPMYPSQDIRKSLSLVNQQTYPNGMVLLEYKVQRDSF